MSRSPCSEFPNANPDLHDGAIFGSLEPCDPCTMLEAPKAAPAPGESGFFERRKQPRGAQELPHVDDELEAFDADEQVLTPLPEPVSLESAEPAPEGFARVVAVLEQVAATLGEGGARRVQDALKGAVPLPPPIAFALLQWRALLEGEDGAALPELTLDEWCAGLLAALFGAHAGELRNRVRAEGIAAFGILDAA